LPPQKQIDNHPSRKGGRQSNLPSPFRIKDFDLVYPIKYEYKENINMKYFKTVLLMTALLSGLLIAVGCAASPENNPASSAGSSSAGAHSSDPAPEGNSVFVSALGSKTNSGLFKASPLVSLQTAVDLAKKSNFTAIYISGNLTLTNLTNYNGVLLEGMTNLAVSGGWNSNFSARNGESILNGAQVSATVVSIQSCKGMNLKGLALTGSFSSDGNGGGINIQDSANCVINCTISNNTAYSGGGIYSGYCVSNTISGLVVNNTAVYSGGGIYIENCAYETYSCAVISNVSSDECGGISCYDGAHNNLFSGDILNNTASGSWIGGIGLVTATYSNIISGKVCGNSAIVSGGGIYMEGYYNVVSGSVMSNITGEKGAGVILWSGASNTFASSCVIRYNRCNTNDGPSRGSGIYQNDGHQDFIQTGAVVTNNYNGSTGTIEDNIYLYFGTL
jgi:predicted outer membrane repeat protein